jgi:hypothetical protein
MNMRYVTAWLAALVCASLGSTSLLASFAAGGTVEVNLTVDWQILQTPIAPSLVGISVSADHQGNGLSANGIAAAAVASTTQIGARLIRFPDDISQSYKWQTASAEARLSTFEFWSLASQASPDKPSDLMVTANLVTGSPDEAAKWVSMANQPFGSNINATLRGSTQPFNIHYWLLGEDIRSYPEKFPTAVSYAASALENATKMKLAWPSISVGLWIDDGSTQEGVEWNTNLLTSIRLRDPGQNGTGLPLIDFVAVASIVEVPNRPVTDATLYPTLYGATATRAEQVVLGAEQAVSSQLAHEVPIAIYRYGVEFGSEGWNQDKGDSLGNAIGLTAMLNTFARHPRIFTAIYDGLNRVDFGALLQVPSSFDVPAGQRFALNPFGEVLSSYSQLATGSAISVDMAGTGASAIKAFYKAPPVGRMPGTERVALLSTLGILDRDAGQMVLFVSNRATTDRVVAHVTVSNTETTRIHNSMLAQTLQSSSLSTDSYTGITHLEPQSEFRDLALVPDAAGAYHFDLILERNSISFFVLTTFT